MSRSEWVRSSACAGNGDCLQVRFYGDGHVTIRKIWHGQPSGPDMHAITPDEWAAFIAGVKNNEFDPPG